MSWTVGRGGPSVIEAEAPAEWALDPATVVPQYPFDPGTPAFSAGTVGVQDWSALTVHEGDLTLLAGQTATDLRINGRLIRGAGGGQVVENVWVAGQASGPPTTDDTRHVMSTRDDHSGGEDRMLLKYVTIKPQTPHWDWNGIRGWRYHLQFVDILHCVDGLSIYPHTAYAGTDTRVLGQCVWVRRMAHFKQSIAGVPVHPSDTETHGDCIHWAGGTNPEFYWSRFDGYVVDATEAGHGPRSGSGGLVNCCIQIDVSSGYGPLGNALFEKCKTRGGWAGQIQCAPGEIGYAGTWRDHTFTKDHGSGTTVRLNGATWTNDGSVYAEDGTAPTVTA